MPKIIKPLIDSELKKAKASYSEKAQKITDTKLSDGKGLCFIAKVNGTKVWRFDFTFKGKRKSMSFGTYPLVTLSRAREKREEALLLLDKGINPIEEKNKDKDKVDTFYTVFEKWLEMMKVEWEKTTYTKNKNRIKNHVYPTLKNKNFKDISKNDILNIIITIQEQGFSEVLTRVLNTLERIYKYAVTYNIVEHNIIADIDRKAIIKKKPIKHRDAITKKEDIKELLLSIDNYENFNKANISTAYSLKLFCYTALRPDNIRYLRWDEVNFEAENIDIPAERMKNKKEFILPLSKQAIKVLREMEQYSKDKSEFVFPSNISNCKVLSENTINHALSRLGFKGLHSAHGFRSMFSTICHDNILIHKIHSDVIESCLSHSELNKIKAAYNRADKMKYYEEKKTLIQWYSDYLNKIKNL